MTTRTGVYCPECGYEYVAELCDGDGRLVSYWGDGSPVVVTCRSCDADFRIKEYVHREWELWPS